MKKYIISFLVATIFLAGAPFVINQAKAQGMTIRDLIIILIEIEVISSDKISAVNSYLANIGEAPIIISEKDNPSVVPTCTAFKYSEWSACSANGTQNQTIISQLPAGCTGGNPEALSRYCTVPGVDTYTITFNDTSHWCHYNGCVLTGSMPDQVIKANTPTRLNSNRFVIPRATFLGWATSDYGTYLGISGVSYADGASITLPTGSAHMDLYAVWGWTDYSYVYFVANGGYGGMSGQEFAPNTSAALTRNNFQKAGYTFAGWSKSLNGPVVYRDEDTFTSDQAGSADVFLYAVWTPLSTPVTPTCTSFEYSAWSPAVCTTGTQTHAVVSQSPAGCVGGNPVLNRSCTVSTPPATTATTYTITFDGDGGTGYMSPQVINANATNYLSISNAFSKTGYSFAGWSTTRGGAVVYSGFTTIAIVGSGDITLYAVWTPVGASAGNSNYGATLVSFDAILRLIKALR